MAQVNQALANAELSVIRDFPGVVFLIPVQVKRMLSEQPPPFLFDVREPSEIRVSAIPGAIPLPPSTSVRDFAGRFGRQLQGRQAVFYCTTGWRAANYILRLQRNAGMDTAGMTNLSGGILRWAADGGAVVDSAGRPTRVIHPNVFWNERLLPSGFTAGY